MEAKITQTERMDGFDAEQMREMLESSSFRLLRARIAGELERKRDICERSELADDVQRAQGAVAVLRTVLALPENILREIESKRR